MPDKDQKAAEQLALDDIQIKLNFRIHPRMPSVYAQHMLIQPGLNEVLLSFFEIVPPIMTAMGSPSAEQIKQLQETGVVAECVARVTVANAVFPNFVRAMQDMLSQLPKKEENADNARDNPKG
jgi:hypothetical protein